eukprot:COSAG05_NODE_118_length_17779_cov_4.419231_2_plen_51_part_00
MSLIITRNNGTDRPESYHNYLKNTFVVSEGENIVGAKDISKETDGTGTSE